MKVLFDTNVILDVLLDREPFANDVSYLLTKVERSEILGFICATTITTIHYLVTKALGPQAVIQHIHSLLSLFEIAPVNRIVLENAVSSNFLDFEDAVLHESACHAGVKYIITRDREGFKNSRLPVFSPAEFIAVLEVLKNNG